MSCAVTYNGEGMVESGDWVRKIPADQNTGNIEGNSVFRAIIVAS